MGIYLKLRVFAKKNPFFVFIWAATPVFTSEGTRLKTKLDEIWLRLYGSVEKNDKLIMM